MAKTSGGWEKVVSILVDTGSEVSLVRPGLLGDEDLQQAGTPIRLVTVSGGTLDGGRRVAKLFLELRSIQGEETKAVEGLFYEAAIGWDMIVGYDFLTKNKRGLRPHKKSIVVEKDGEVKLLVGTDKSQGKPYSTGDSISADCVRARGVHVGTMPCAECRKSGCSTKIQAVDGKAWKTDDYAVRSDLVSEVVKSLDAGVPTVDAFASETNKRFAKFWSVTDDAFEKDWGQEDLLWINAPFQKISQVVQKVVKEKAKAILVVPEWETELWWKGSRTSPCGASSFGRSPSSSRRASCCKELRDGQCGLFWLMAGSKAWRRRKHCRGWDTEKEMRIARWRWSMFCVCTTGAGVATRGRWDVVWSPW